MNKPIISLLLLFCCIIYATGQSVIKIPFSQPPLFTVSPQQLYISLSENETKEIGTEIEINGGSGNYLFQWLHNGEVIGTEPTLTIDKSGTYQLIVNDREGCESVAVFEISNNTHIMDEHQTSFNLYPNPTHGPLYISSDKLTEVKNINIHRLNGELIRSIDYRNAETSSNPYYIDLSSAINGYYLVTIQFEKERKTRIIIKE
ncbi:T9SS type A sorting domain-containing protein [Parabacteroides sp. OttesenSCG-928-N08]|nr:T9SS type A sorting domain-containing protein [Parabacteroides sp. OttesenSCG-928-N08]